MFPMDAGYLCNFSNPYGRLAHGSLKLTVTSPTQTFTEPLTLREVKDYLALTTSPDTSDDDATLEGLIASARVEVEKQEGRDLIRKQWDLALDYFSQREFELRDDLFSVDLVRYRDSAGNYTTLTENTDYVVDTARQPGVITPPPNAWWPVFVPWPSSAVLIRFTAGVAPTDAFWNDRGKKMKTNMLIRIKAWFNGDDAAEYGNRTGVPWAAEALGSGIPRVG